jgi:hypothetical protein
LQAFLFLLPTGVFLARGVFDFRALLFDGGQELLVRLSGCMKLALRFSDGLLAALTGLSLRRLGARRLAVSLFLSRLEEPCRLSFGRTFGRRRFRGLGFNGLRFDRLGLWRRFRLGSGPFWRRRLLDRLFPR